MEYIVFIHRNSDSPVSAEEWEFFLMEARHSGLFQGGSEIAKRIQIGQKEVPDITQWIGGFMRFKSTDIAAIQTLLQKHPVLSKGGTLELCEMPKS